jgi:hypothetical protein
MLVLIKMNLWLTRMPAQFGMVTLNNIDPIFGTHGSCSSLC